jgi:bifunctional DNA-binding transcriptional regulator/antitoxin component of YhaV-PrlF toxin-antitoxin module
MHQSTLTSKNQTTIPKSVVDALNLKPSGKLVYEIGPDGTVVLSAKTATFASVARTLPRKKTQAPTRSVAEMRATAKDMAVKRMKRAMS